MILYLALAMVSSALLALGLLMMKARSDHLPVAVGAIFLFMGPMGLVIPRQDLSEAAVAAGSG